MIGTINTSKTKNDENDRGHQTHKIEKIPVLLYGKEFWNGCMDWLKQVVLLKYSNISSEDIDLFHLVDNPDEVLKIIEEHYKNQNYSPNF